MLRYRHDHFLPNFLVDDFDSHSCIPIVRPWLLNDKGKRCSTGEVVVFGVPVYIKSIQLERDEKKYLLSAIVCSSSIFRQLICFRNKSFVLCSLINSLDAGSSVRGNKDGINQEFFLLCSIDRWICPGSYALDRLRASLHALLAPYAPLGFGQLIATVCCWCMAPEVLPGCTKERTTQGVQKEGIGNILLWSFLGRDGCLDK